MRFSKRFSSKTVSLQRSRNWCIENRFPSQISRRVDGVVIFLWNGSQSYWPLRDILMETITLIIMQWRCPFGKLVRRTKRKEIEPIFKRVVQNISHHPVFPKLDEVMCSGVTIKHTMVRGDFVRVQNDTNSPISREHQFFILFKNLVELVPMTPWEKFCLAPLVVCINTVSFRYFHNNTVICAYFIQISVISADFNRPSLCET